MTKQDESTVRAAEESSSTLHYAKRGQILEDNAFAGVSGVEAERMRARTLLTAEQEKKLLRRIDWHIMPLCALMFLMKNLDANNVCLIRISDKNLRRTNRMARSPTSVS